LRVYPHAKPNDIYENKMRTSSQPGKSEGKRALTAATIDRGWPHQAAVPAIDRNSFAWWSPGTWREASASIVPPTVNHP
jgi:hypothetical protein